MLECGEHRMPRPKHGRFLDVSHGHRLLYSQDITFSSVTDGDVAFLNPSTVGVPHTKRALIVLNQPFSRNLLEMLWTTCFWHCCADGGANRLFDLLSNGEQDDLRAQWV